MLLDLGSWMMEKRALGKKVLLLNPFYSRYKFSLIPQRIDRIGSGGFNCLECDCEESKNES